jgi:hypothetical protein
MKATTSSCVALMLLAVHSCSAFAPAAPLTRVSQVSTCVMFNHSVRDNLLLLTLAFHITQMTQRPMRPTSSLRMAGGFETKEAAAARIAKQQASQKKADSLKQQQQQQQPAKAAVQQQPLSAQLEELSSRPSPPPPAEEPFKNPVGSRADEILRRAVSTSCCTACTRPHCMQYNTEPNHCTSRAL